jgi:hypothetical protein
MITRSKLTTWLWRHLDNYFLNIMHFFINGGLKKNKNGLVSWLDYENNSRIHIKFHSKLFIVTKQGLKNEIIKIIVKFYFVKP